MVISRIRLLQALGKETSYINTQSAIDEDIKPSKL